MLTFEIVARTSGMYLVCTGTYSVHTMLYYCTNLYSLVQVRTFYPKYVQVRTFSPKYVLGTYCPLMYVLGMYQLHTA